MKAVIRITLLVVFINASGYTILLGQDQAAFIAANEAYQKEQYETAIAGYESILASGLHSTSLYYNLGNAYYRLGKLGRAVLNYERALKLDPGDTQVRKNLRIVNQELKDIQVAIQQSRVVKGWYKVQNQLSDRAWSGLALLLLWLGLGGIAVWLKSRVRNYKKIGFVLGVTLIVLCILPFIFAYSSMHNKYLSNEAIIMVEETSLKAGPENNSKTIQLLHEGTKVKIIDQIGSWNRVELNDTSEGWLPADTSTRI